MGLRHDQGIVLRGYPFGEADKVVVILSPNHGKLRTVAKGVRKTKSRFGGRLEPFNHVDVVLYEGRNLDTVTQVSILETFPGVRADLDRVSVAGAMVALADMVAQEGESAHRLFLLLQRGLRALERGEPGGPLAVSFYAKAADVIGVAPSLRDCAGCGGAAAAARFSFAAGGVVCERCAPAGAVRLAEGVVARLADLAEADLDALPEPAAALDGEAQGVMRRFLEYHLERRLNTLVVPGA